MKKVIHSIVLVLAIWRRRVTAATDTFQQHAAAAAARSLRPRFARRRRRARLLARRAARGPVGHSDRAESVRHRAGDQACAAGLAREGERPDRRVRRFRAPSRVEEKQLELDQIDEQIKKAQADLAIRNNQDQVELLRARYSVRRAELEVKRNELSPQIDAKKNLLNLEEAKRR